MGMRDMHRQERPPFFCKNVDRRLENLSRDQLLHSHGALTAGLEAHGGKKNMLAQAGSRGVKNCVIRYWRLHIYTCSGSRQIHS